MRNAGQGITLGSERVLATASLPRTSVADRYGSLGAGMCHQHYSAITKS
jgi:hypothetical protein